MAIESASAEQVQTARDEVFKAAAMLQFYAQGEGEQAGDLTAVNAQVTAAEAALTAVKTAA